MCNNGCRAGGVRTLNDISVAQCYIKIKIHNGATYYPVKTIPSQRDGFKRKLRLKKRQHVQVFFFSRVDDSTVQQKDVGCVMDFFFLLSGFT